VRHVFASTNQGFARLLGLGRVACPLDRYVPASATFGINRYRKVMQPDSSSSQ